MDMHTVPRKALRRRALEILRAAAYVRSRCGLAPSAPGALLLMYHSVAPPETARFIDPAWRLAPEVFERQVRFLARHCRVVSLDALTESIRRGVAPEPGTVVMTFDDGYRDTLEVAAPILARYNLPATLYLPTAYVTHEASQWIDRLYTAFRSRTRNRLVLDGTPVDLATPRGPLSAYGVLRDRLRAADYLERQRLLDAAERDLRPGETPPRLTLAWTEVQDLVRRYPSIEIGGHSVHHRDLSSCAPDLVAAEIQGCRTDLERELGRTPRHFSFPYGRSTPEARQIVIDAGFRSAVSAAPTLLAREHSDPFALGRLDPNLPMTQFRFWASGAHAATHGRLARC